MRIKRRLNINEKTQMVVVSHFDKKNTLAPRDALQRIMINIAKQKIEEIKENK